VASVPWEAWSDVPKRTPRSPSYAGLTQRAGFAEWLKAQREAKISRKQLARELWPSKERDEAKSADRTTARIKDYEEPQRDEYGRVVDVTVPSRDVLRRICDILKISWLSAFASAGYYRDVLAALAALVDLGYRWLDTDGAFVREGARRSFRSAGVTELGGKIVWDAMREQRFLDRYIEGAWAARPPKSKPILADTKVLPEIIRRYLAAEARTAPRCACVVPKPMAAAILVAASGFPRRGDVWKAGVDMYAVHLLEAATPLVNYALRGKKIPLTGNIERADRALSDIRAPLDSRRVAAAEHMIAWADGISQCYTHYARLASMAYFGVSGCSEDKLSAEFYLPKLRPAQLPNVNLFQAIEHLE
jgi:hypothetical protein